MEGADDVCGALAKVSFAEFLGCSAGYSQWPIIRLPVVIKKMSTRCTQTVQCCSRILNSHKATGHTDEAITV